MNSQALGGLASDQKIDKVFHVFGYSIPVGKDGRRMWPDKFKAEMAKQMNSGKLTINDVQKTCKVPQQTAYQWEKEFGKRSKAEKKPAFAKLNVADDETAAITIRRGETEILLPAEYCIEAVARLVGALERQS